METFKYSIGPFEIFSSFISGIPIVFASYLLFIPKAKLSLDTLILKATFSNLMLLIILCYLVGGVISGISYPYFKIFSKILKRDYLLIEKSFLRNIDKVRNEYSKEEFNELILEDRIAYLTKIYIGTCKLSWVNDRILPYIRLKNWAMAQNAQNHIAFNIMYRNLSFGFLILTISILIFLFFNKAFTFFNIIFPILTFVISLLAISRALTFRLWYSREILLTFYYLNIGEISIDSREKTLI